jgi:hypothetical protein
MAEVGKDVGATKHWARDSKIPPAKRVEVFSDGMTATKARAAGRWASIMMRCYAPHYEHVAKDYRDRGIRVDPRWHDFSAFFRHMYQVVGPQPAGTSIDRIDSDGPYSPENCRWATRIQQARNRRYLQGRAGRLITACGKSMTIADWSSESGVDEDTIRMRLKMNWAAEDAVVLPPGSKRHNRRIIELDGVARSIHEWARQPGVTVDAETIGARFFNRSWSATQAIYSPPNTYIKSRRRYRVRLAARGRELTPEEWAKEPDVPKGIKPATIYARFAYSHWTPEEAVFTTPGPKADGKRKPTSAPKTERSVRDSLKLPPKIHVASFPDGMTYAKARLTRTWAWMLERCYAPRNEYIARRYRDRGIRVDKRWHDFNAFYRDMCEKEQPLNTTDYSLDRIDNDGPYSNANCRWATASQQANNRSNNSRVAAFGEQLTLAEWEAKYGVDQETIRRRLMNGDEPEDAVSRRRYGKRKDNVRISYEGEPLTASEWARRPGSCGSHGAILNRYKNNWSPGDAIFTPLGQTRPGCKSNRGRPKHISCRGQNLTCAEWARQPDIADGLTAELIYKRYYYLKWTAEETLFTPKGGIFGPNADIRRRSAVEKNLKHPKRR